MSRKAVIDIGTNSIKFYIAELDGKGGIRTVLDKAEIARLGEGLRETGGISDEAAERNKAAIAGFVATAKENGVDEIFAVGTMALRKAKNTASFVAKVRDACGVAIQVIPGEEEARLAYLAALSGLDVIAGKNVVFDSGGGSTEFIIGSGPKIDSKQSINLGAVIITEEFLKSDPVTEQQVSAAMADVRKKLEGQKLGPGIDQLIGIGGTVTTMAAVKHKMVVYDPNIVQGTRIAVAEVESQIAAYKSRSVEDRRKITGLHPKRADIILAGAIIVKAVLEKCGVDSFSVSDRGLRHGLIFDKFGKARA